MRNGAMLFTGAMMFVGWSAVAQAQQPDANCPPGSWFCEQSPPAGAAPAPAPDAAPALPAPADAAAPPADAPKAAPAPNAGNAVAPQPQQGPVVVYQQAPPPPAVVVVRPRPTYVQGPPPPPPAPPKRARTRHWGVNLRLQGVLMDSRQHDLAGMGGAGVSLRLRPERHFAFDLGLDVLGGRDYEGRRRSEVPFTISGIVFANPRSKVQFYMLGGLNWAAASVSQDSDEWVRTRDFSYFGAHLGPGLEFRLSPPVSLNVDLIGFIRGRTDGDARSDPEFIDPETGRTTNTSGGGLLRGGITFYW